MYGAGGYKVKKVDIFAFRLKSITFTSTSRFVSFAAISAADDNMSTMAMEI